MTLCKSALVALAFFAFSATAQAESLFGLFGNCGGDGKAKPMLTSTAVPDSTRIGASTKGATGTFFLEGLLSQIYVAKFEKEIDDGVGPARMLMALAGVPHDAFRAHSADRNDLRTLLNKLKLAAGSNQFISKDLKTQAAVHAKIDQLGKELPNIKFLFLTDFIRPANGLGDLEDLLLVSPVTAAQNVLVNAAAVSLADLAVPQSDADFKVREVKGLIVGLQALNRPENQRMLGVIYVLDAFLGNADRLTDQVNRGNLLVTGNDETDYCLAAIDNESYAPDPAYVAVAKQAEEMTSRGLGGTHKINLGVAVTKDVYYNTLMGLFTDPLMRAKVYDGPMSAFDATRQPNSQSCLSGSPIIAPEIRSKRIMPLNQVVRIRKELQDGIQSSIDRLLRREYGADFTVRILDRDAANKAVAVNDPCQLNAEFTITDRSRGPNAIGTASIARVNWAEFEKNMLSGADAAVSWLVHQHDIAKKITTGMPHAPFNAVSLEGFRLRQLYLEKWNPTSTPAAVKASVFFGNPLTMKGFNDITFTFNPNNSAWTVSK